MSIQKTQLATMTTYSTRPPAYEGLFTLKHFTFESGQTLPELNIGYLRFGELNAQRDNLLLVLPGTGNVRHSVLEHIGPGRAYDSRYGPCSSAISKTWT